MIAHVALWTTDLERLRAFYECWFEARAGARYASVHVPGFTSYFLEFPSGGARLELMSVPDLRPGPDAPAAGWAHVAFALGSRAAVDAMTERMRAGGVRVLSGPRETGDGYYESVVEDPDGNPVELTV